MKKVFLVCGIIVVVLASFFILLNNTDSFLKVYFLDVGQGDASLIRTPDGQNILVDGGPDDSVIYRLSEQLPIWDRTIDLMILTHPHSDHISGQIDVLEKYNVKHIIYSGVIHSSPNYLEWLQLVKEKNIPLTIIDRPQKVSMGGVKIDFLYPFNSLAGLPVDSLNNSSIVFKLLYGDKTFLFTGDIEKETEEKLLSRYGDNIKSSVLKVAHHGSKTSENIFQEIVKPEIAVISVGENKFGHPSERIVKSLNSIGSRLFRTDMEGTVVLVSDGEKIWLE